jgi:hypothetical protein
MALRVISPSRLPQRHGVQGWPAIPRARRYGQLNRNRQKHHLKAPRRLGLLSPYKRAGQGSTTKRRMRKKNKRQQARHKIEIDISSNHPCPLFPIFETWARRPLSHACNPYTSTSMQGNTNFSSPLDVGPSFARTRINSRVFSLHHHPGKRHAAFTRWFRTPSGPNTDKLFYDKGNSDFMSTKCCSIIA